MGSRTKTGSDLRFKDEIGFEAQFGEVNGKKDWEIMSLQR